LLGGRLAQPVEERETHTEREQARKEGSEREREAVESQKNISEIQKKNPPDSTEK
jgi:hypothetical protein